MTNDNIENSDTPYGNVLVGSGRSGDENKCELNREREGPIYEAQKEETEGRTMEVGDGVIRNMETSTTTRRDKTEMVERWNVMEGEALAALYYLGSSDPAASVSNRYNS